MSKDDAVRKELEKSDDSFGLESLRVMLHNIQLKDI